LAFAILLISGLVHGFWTQRWQTSDALDNACADLAEVPRQIGPWNGTDVDVDPEPFKQARAVGYWMRTFSRSGSQRSITVILMCGLAGHMSVHTPDVCYRGAGYEMAGEQFKQAVTFGPDNHTADFWSARFRQPAKALGNELRIYWAWTADGNWQAPASPRLSLGGNPFLFKLYVVRETSGETGQDETSLQFFQELLPILEKSLFSTNRGDGA
jgi:hypothetical protein